MASASQSARLERASHVTNDAYPQLPELKGRIAASDHAFASGSVFACPASLEDAISATGSETDGTLLLKIWSQFLTGGDVGKSVLLGLGARLINERAGQQGVTIGHDTVIRGILRSEQTGRINIGPFVYVGDGSILYAREHLSIGTGTLIAHRVNIFDNDTHPIDAGERLAHFQRLLGHKPAQKFSIRAAPVRIGSRCWIAVNCVICKGVTIGDDTIVAANSVVTTDLPSGVIAAGNPAVPVRELTRSPQAGSAEVHDPLHSQYARAVAYAGSGGYAGSASVLLRRILRRLLPGTPKT